MGYYIDDIINSEYTKIKMIFNDDEDKIDTLITGFMVDDSFSLSGNASWGELSDDEMSGVEGFKNAGKTFGKLAGYLGAKGVKGITPEAIGGGIGTAIGGAGRLGGIGSKLVQQTVAKWEGTEKPTFDVGLLFLRTSSSDRKPEEQAKAIISRCYPHFYGVVMRSPMGYIPMAQLKDFSDGEEGRYTSGDASKHTGTCTLAIGKWFMASNLLLQSASFEFSKECTSDGSPLYAQGKVQFISARAVSANEYKSWFTSGGGASGVFDDLLNNAKEFSALSKALHDPMGVVNEAVSGALDMGKKAITGVYGEGAPSEEPPMP